MPGAGLKSGKLARSFPGFLQNLNGAAAWGRGGLATCYIRPGERRGWMLLGGRSQLRSARLVCTLVRKAGIPTAFNWFRPFGLRTNIWGAFKLLIKDLSFVVGSFDYRFKRRQVLGRRGDGDPMCKGQGNTLK